MGEWFSIEVLDGTFPAGTWAESHGDALIWAAQEHGVTDWTWHHHSWGVILEIELADDVAWDAFREAPAVRASLDAVPDPTFGLILHRGRGGSSGTREPRPRRPLSGAGAEALPVPEAEPVSVPAPVPVVVAAPAPVLTA